MSILTIIKKIISKSIQLWRVTRLKYSESVNHQNVLIYKADILLKKGKHEFRNENAQDALKYFLKASSIDPDNPVIHIAIGNCYFSMDSYKFALDSFEYANHLAKPLPKTIKKITKIYMIVNLFNEDADFLKRLSTHFIKYNIWHNSKEFLLRLVEALIINGDIKQAKSFIERGKKYHLSLSGFEIVLALLKIYDGAVISEISCDKQLFRSDSDILKEIAAIAEKNQSLKTKAYALEARERLLSKYCNINHRLGLLYLAFNIFLDEAEYKSALRVLERINRLNPENDLYSTHIVNIKLMALKPSSDLIDAAEFNNIVELSIKIANQDIDCSYFNGELLSLAFQLKGIEYALYLYNRWCRRYPGLNLYYIANRLFRFKMHNHAHSCFLLVIRGGKIHNYMFKEFILNIELLLCKTYEIDNRISLFIEVFDAVLSLDIMITPILRFFNKYHDEINLTDSFSFQNRSAFAVSIIQHFETLDLPSATDFFRLFLAKFIEEELLFEYLDKLINIFKNGLFIDKALIFATMQLILSLEKFNRITSNHPVMDFLKEFSGKNIFDSAKMSPLNQIDSRDVIYADDSTASGITLDLSELNAIKPDDTIYITVPPMGNTSLILRLVESFPYNKIVICSNIDKVLERLNNYFIENENVSTHQIVENLSESLENFICRHNRLREIVFAHVYSLRAFLPKYFKMAEFDLEKISLRLASLKSIKYELNNILSVKAFLSKENPANYKHIYITRMLLPWVIKELLHEEGFDKHTWIITGETLHNYIKYYRISEPTELLSRTILKSESIIKAHHLNNGFFRINRSSHCNILSLKDNESCRVIEIKDQNHRPPHKKCKICFIDSAVPIKAIKSRRNYYQALLLRTLEDGHDVEFTVVNSKLLPLSTRNSYHIYFNDLFDKYPNFTLSFIFGSTSRIVREAIEGKKQIDYSKYLNKLIEDDEISILEKNTIYSNFKAFDESLELFDSIKNYLNKKNPSHVIGLIDYHLLTLFRMATSSLKQSTYVHAIQFGVAALSTYDWVEYDTLFTTDIFSSDDYKNQGIGAETICITGSCEWEDIISCPVNSFKHKYLKYKRLIGFLNQPLYLSTYSSYISKENVLEIYKFLGRLADKNPEAIILIKPHPREDLNILSKYVPSHPRIKILPLDITLPDFLHSIDIAIGVFSASLFSAMALGIPVIAVNPPMNLLDSLQKFITNYGGIATQSYDEILTWFDKYNQCKLDNNIAKLKEFSNNLREYPPSKRMLDYMLSL